MYLRVFYFISYHKIPKNISLNVSYSVSKINALNLTHQKAINVLLYSIL
jgi:hypothetical protein